MVREVGVEGEGERRWKTGRGGRDEIRRKGQRRKMERAERGGKEEEMESDSYVRISIQVNVAFLRL